MASGDLIFLHSGFMPCCTARVDKRFDGYSTLQLMAGGHVVVSYDDNVHQLNGAWYWPAFPGPRIRMMPAPGCPSWVHRYVAFKGPLVARWQAEGLMPAVPQPAVPIDSHAHRFDKLLASVRGSRRWDMLRAINSLEQVLIDLAEERGTPTEGHAWQRRVLDVLDTTNEFSPDYESVAGECGVSLRTLRERFRRLCGTPLHHYAVTRRLARARGLLGDTDMPIKAVAHELGYEDVYYFTRQFRTHVGVTPGQYRRSRQR